MTRGARPTRRSNSAPVSPRFLGTELDVLAHGGHEQLIVRILEHQADPAPDLEEVRRGDTQAGDRDRPRLGSVNPVHVEDEGCLARSVGPEQSHPLPAMDVEIDVASRPRCRRDRRSRARGSR